VRTALVPPLLNLRRFAGQASLRTERSREVVSAEDREGVLIGSGDGVVKVLRSARVRKSGRIFMSAGSIPAA
jgi:hypothetical protein